MAITNAPTRVAEIVTNNLGKTYLTESGPVVAMAGVNLQVEQGEFVTVIGASGCGKSTLLRILAGFERSTEGTLTVGGQPVLKPGPQCGVVFQDYGLFPWLTVRENVAFGPRQSGTSRAEARLKADSCISAVGLTTFADKFPRELSGGMQQRVAIARVLANNPVLMLMDEPFGALDALTRTTMQHELSRIHREMDTTIVFVTHSIEEAVFLADRVVVMSGGAAHGVPGHVEAVVPISLADRDTTSAEFNAIRRRLGELIHTGTSAEPVA